MHSETGTTEQNVAQLQRQIAALEAQLAQAQQTIGELRGFAQLVDAASEGIGMTDLTGRLVYANPAWHRITGHPAPLDGLTIFDLHTESAEVMEAVAGEVLSTGFWHGQLTNRRADGSSFPVLVSAFLIRDEAGAPSGMAAIVRDISAQVAQADQVHAFEALAENAPDGVSIADLDGRFFYANPAFRKMTGFGDRIIGATIFDIYVEDSSVLAVGAEQVMTQGFWQGRLTYRRPDGTTFPGAVSVFLMRDRAGQPHAFGAVARDISAEQQAEAERSALQEQVIQAQQAALRELSTPLIPITGRVVAMPLIGSVDSQRAQQILETLLTGVAESQASTAILDITGVPVVDTQVANALLRAAQAVRLLGAEVILTGIRPEVAQTLVGLGADLSGITTHSTLQSGIARALAPDDRTSRRRATYPQE